MDSIEEFIQRRFKKDCNWTSGNCYYFALILKSRFGGTIYYDPIIGHFLCRIGFDYYDWSGKVDISSAKLYTWDQYKDFDILDYQRVVDGCIL